MPRQQFSAPELDAQWTEMFEAENRLIKGRKASALRHANGNGNGHHPYLIGLCLSGGGIRSATVGLGILQAFAGKNLLKHIDYLSSVSGGGYTAAGLALHYAQLKDRDADPDTEFPFGPEPSTKPEPQRLAYLRNHANYLSHTGLADLASGFFVVARALLMNMFMWITLGGTLLAGLMLFFQWRAGFSNDNCVIYATQCWGNQLFDFLLTAAAGLGAVLAALAVGVSLSSWQLTASPYHAGSRPAPQWLFVISALAGAGVSLLLARDALGQTDRFVVIPALTLVVLVTLAFFALAVSPSKMAQGGETTPSRKYARRYAQESFCGRALIVIALLMVLGSLPSIRNVLAEIPMLGNLAGGEGRGPLATVVYLVALGAALYGYYRANLQGALGLGSSFLIIAGSAFLCFGALLLGYEVAAGQARLLRSGEIVTFGDAFTLAAPLLALALCLCANINDVGLGRYYRDRLMETFMPDRARVERDEIGPAATADRFRLTQLVTPLLPPELPGASVVKRAIDRMVHGQRHRQDRANTRLVGPFPIINANLMTHAFGDATARRRRGDGFVMTPLGCGSNTTGWRSTEKVIDGRLSLATAMATSGAAANPRGGFAGTGPTTNPAVVIAMSLLSIRLGYWLRWEDRPGLFGFLNPNGNHLRPGALDLVGRPGPFIELTDGGHFENLGLYELVRRRCGLIIVCDGGDDRAAAYANFTVAARRVEEDFGATFDFDFEIGNGSGFERSGPQHVVARATGDEYPKDAEYARRGYFLASIRYDPSRARVPMAKTGPDSGLVIYLKSAMIPSLTLTSRSYKGANPDFPYESTADQFFSAEQFEAYRDVGVRIASQMLEETDLVHLFADGVRPSLAALRRTHGFAGPETWQPWGHRNGNGHGGHAEAPPAA